MRFIEPRGGSDREGGLRLLAAEGMDLVIGVGLIFSDDRTQLAKAYPNMRFAVVDYTLAIDSAGNAVRPPANLAANVHGDVRSSSANRSPDSESSNPRRIFVERTRFG